MGVLGAGSWGTALALQAERAGQRVTLWGRDAATLASMQEQRHNARYLPGARFGDALRATASLDETLDRASAPSATPDGETGHRDDGDGIFVLVAVPSHAFRATLEALAGRVDQRSLRLAWATKGLELDTGRMTHELVDELLPACRHRAVLSGPSFAREVGQGLPTAITAASGDDGFADEVAERFASETFRVYTSVDVIGVETGGAVKNIVAIAAGLSDGLGYGANARVALVTRGLREMARFGRAIGAHEATFQSLACMGDLVLTCTDDQSRNRRMGLALARGDGVAAATADIGQVVEGVRAARAIHARARELDVDMPICEQVYRVLHEGVPVAAAVSALLARRSGEELV